MAESQEATVFSRIIAGELPADKVYEDEQCVVIRDIAPRAPVHLLVIPRKPIRMLCEAGPEDRDLLGHLMLVAAKVAEDAGTGDSFRLVVNNGTAVGMTVFHLHLHVMGGGRLSWEGD